MKKSSLSAPSVDELSGMGSVVLRKAGEHSPLRYAFEQVARHAGDAPSFDRGKFAPMAAEAYGRAAMLPWFCDPWDFAEALGVRLSPRAQTHLDVFLAIASHILDATGATWFVQDRCLLVLELAYPRLLIDVATTESRPGAKRFEMPDGVPDLPRWLYEIALGRRSASGVTHPAISRAASFGCEFE